MKKSTFQECFSKVISFSIALSFLILSVKAVKACGKNKLNLQDLSNDITSVWSTALTDVAKGWKLVDHDATIITDEAELLAADLIPLVPPLQHHVTRTAAIIHSGQTLCNGAPELCSKKYNEVTYITSHNGPINRRNSLFNIYDAFASFRSSNIVRYNINDQDLSLTAQFKLGIRATKLPVINDAGSLVSCHGLVATDKDKYENEICGVLPSYLVGVISECHHFFTTVANDSCTFDPSKRSLISVLDEVNSFMLSSPNEIYTLFLEDETEESFASIVDIVKKHPISRMVNVNQTPSSWPTLKNMISTGKRVVIFVSSSNYNETLAQSVFNNRESYFYISPYSFASLRSLKADIGYQTAPNISTQSTLSVIQHIITPLIAGDDNDATSANDISVLKPRVENYVRALGKNPNFIWVDFVEYSQTGVDPLIYANYLNAAEGSTVYPTGQISLRSSSSSGKKCVDLQNASVNSGASLIINDCTMNATQSFVHNSSTREIKVNSNKINEMCVTVSPNQTEGVYPVQISTCFGGNNQIWNYSASTGMLTATIGSHTGCMNLNGTAGNNGALITFADCNGSSNQQWVVNN